MSKALNVGGTIYNYPDQGTNPNWGQDAADWAEAITDQVNSLITEDDVPRTSFTIENDQSAPQPIPGLAFFTGRVRTAFIEYTITRKATEVNPVVELNESGRITITYRDTLGTWTMEQETSSGLAGVLFSVTDGGQVLYQSSDLPDQNYSNMVFSARAFVRE